MRGLQASGKQGKRGNSSVRKRKKHAKGRKREEKGCILRGTTGRREKKHQKGLRNDKKLSRSVQNPPKIMKIMKNGSERSPRDKSGGFGFENMFWPLGNVARPEGVSRGCTGGGPGCVCAYGDRGACVCPVCICIRSLHVHMSRPYHLFYIYSAYKQECEQAVSQGDSGSSASKKDLKMSYKFFKILKYSEKNIISKRS